MVSHFPKETKMISKHIKLSTYIGWGVGGFSTGLLVFISWSAAFFAAANLSAIQKLNQYFEYLKLIIYLLVGYKQHREWLVEVDSLSHYLISLVIVHSIENQGIWKSEKYEFTLLALDVFFDDTDIHFSTSSLFFEWFGVVTVGVVSMDIGGDDLFIFSDSDVRNLRSKDYF